MACGPVLAGPSDSTDPFASLARAYTWERGGLVRQVTLYIDVETSARMKAAAKAAGVSVSRWVADLIRAGTQAEWPASDSRKRTTFP
jgi:hypothetical protein